MLDDQSHDEQSINEAKIKFVFSAEKLNGEMIEEECVVYLSQSDMQHIIDPNEGWVTLICEEN